MSRMVQLTIAMLLAGAVIAGCQTVSDEMRAGIAAYGSAQYEKAISHFQRAAELDPVLITPHLYLAYSYAQQYIPGAEAADNVAVGESAVRQFRQVLALNLAQAIRCALKHFAAWLRCCST